MLTPQPSVVIAWMSSAPARRGVHRIVWGALVVSPITVPPSSQRTRARLPPSGSGVNVAVSGGFAPPPSALTVIRPAGGRLIAPLCAPLPASATGAPPAAGTAAIVSACAVQLNQCLRQVDGEAVTVIAARWLVPGQPRLRLVRRGAGDDTAVAVDDAHLQRGRRRRGVACPAFDVRAANPGDLANDRGLPRGQRAAARRPAARAGGAAACASACAPASCSPAPNSAAMIRARQPIARCLMIAPDPVPVA
ncbi:MAG: hypothetical protein IPI73_26100 [Betaproteobacteria bacterium]|nr:hypothetical protein [Betaproteobacteria bacterium]